MAVLYRIGQKFQVLCPSAGPSSSMCKTLTLPGTEQTADGPGAVRPLRVVSIFNRYALRGGEEEVFETEIEMLANRGCTVTPVSIKTVPPEGIVSKAVLGLHAVWSGEWYRRITDLLVKERPSVVHVHNSFPVMSPSIYYACQDAGVPVVQTLHNYRLVCPGSLLYRDGRVCEDCVKGGLYQGVQHG